jgi:HSP20 family protein
MEAIMLERKEWTTDLEGLVNRAFADFPFLTEFQFPRPIGLTAPAMDVYEKDGTYLLDLSVPGYEAKDVSVEVNGSTVTVSGSHKDAEEKQNARYYRRELRTGSFTRSVTLPQDLDPEKVEASLTKGVLTVTLTPMTPIAPKKILVKGE